MQNPILKFRQSSFISEKPGYLSEKLKTSTSSNISIVRALDDWGGGWVLKKNVKEDVVESLNINGQWR